ncbi:MAG: NADH-quinone oxidoreductase subunit C [Thermodesulfobacteriota bacterium]
MERIDLISKLRSLAALGMPDEPEEVPVPAVEEEDEADAKAKKKKAKPEPRKNGLLETSHAEKGVHVDVQVNADQVVAAAEILNESGLSLDCVTGVDWLADKEMELVYDYCYYGDYQTSDGAAFRVVVRARIPRDEATIPTVSHIFPGANWHEREVFEFMDINFAGHPELKRLLLPEDADYFPLRKDFKGL